MTAKVAVLSTMVDGLARPLERAGGLARPLEKAGGLARPKGHGEMRLLGLMGKACTGCRSRLLCLL